ncbi:MAG: hypothetical protein ACW99Q_14455 [Candidatus Kariarchaeaceae archaeon]
MAKGVAPKLKGIIGKMAGGIIEVELVLSGQTFMTPQYLEII